MIKILGTLWQRSPLERLLHQHRRRDEHRRQLERTRRAVDAAHYEIRRRLRYWSTPLSTAFIERIGSLDARWQRENEPDAVESAVEPKSLELEFDALTRLGWALWRLDVVASHPRCWVQELRAADAAEAPAVHGASQRGRRAEGLTAGAARLASLANRLVHLDGRYQRLTAELPTSEQAAPVTREVTALERGFRQLAAEVYPLWAVRFPRARQSRGDELFLPLIMGLHNQQQPGSTPGASNDGEFNLFDDEATAFEDER